MIHVEVRDEHGLVGLTLPSLEDFPADVVTAVGHIVDRALQQVQSVPDARLLLLAMLLRQTADARAYDRERARLGVLL